MTERQIPCYTQLAFWRPAYVYSIPVGPTGVLYRRVTLNGDNDILVSLRRSPRLLTDFYVAYIETNFSIFGGPLWALLARPSLRGLPGRL